MIVDPSDTRTRHRRLFDLITGEPDAQLLLEALGIVEYGTDRILPDDHRDYSDVRPTGRIARDDQPLSRPTAPESPRRPADCTTPPGLANLLAMPAPPPAAAKSAGRKPAAAKKPYTPRPETRTAKCGTIGGNSAHKRRGEPICDACKAAEAQYRKDRRGGITRPRPPVVCGTYNGAQKHRRLKETICHPCAEAERAYNRDRHHSRTDPRRGRAS